MKHIRRCGALAAATLSGAALAATHIVDIAWPPDGRFAHNAQIAAGKYVEVCGKLSVGEGVRWSFTASAPVDFNIHYHVGKEAEFPAKQAQTRSGQDILRVAVREDYCWMWSNKSSNRARIDVRLQRQN